LKIGFSITSNWQKNSRQKIGKKVCRQFCKWHKGLTDPFRRAIIYTYTGRGNPMTVPSWQHHSKKEQKRHLKPQALRDAKKRRQALKIRLLGRI
jgi:hypothetical protein